MLLTIYNWDRTRNFATSLHGFNLHPFLSLKTFHKFVDFKKKKLKKMIQF